ncbi:MAG: DUF333 domain-containing protein [Patescibacteria group bacterium]
MKKTLLALSVLLLAGCSFGDVELTKESTACELSGKAYAPGELVPLGDDCNSCVCSAAGKLENCSANKCEAETGLANPAATKCLVDGFAYEIRADANGGQFGVCTDSANKECDEWQYFRGECTLGTADAAPLIPAASDQITVEEKSSDATTPAETVTPAASSDEVVVEDATTPAN